MRSDFYDHLEQILIFFELDSEMAEPDIKKIISVIVSIAIFFSGGMTYGQHGPFFPTEALQKGSTMVWVGFITGSFDFFSILASLVAANVFNVRQSKLLFTAGSVVVGVSCLCFGFTYLIHRTSFYNWTCLIIRCTGGTGAFFSRAFGMTILTSTLPEHSAVINGVVEVSIALGFVLGPAFGSLMYSIGGFPLPFIVSGSTMTILSVICMLILETPENLKQLNEQKSNESDHDQQIKVAETVHLVGLQSDMSFMAFLFKPRLILATLPYFFTCSFVGYLTVALAPYLDDIFGVTGKTAGYYFLSFFLVGSISGMIIGKVTQLGYGIFIYSLGPLIGSFNLFIFFIPVLLPNMMTWFFWSPFYQFRECAISHKRLPFC